MRRWKRRIGYDSGLDDSFGTTVTSDFGRLKVAGEELGDRFVRRSPPAFVVAGHTPAASVRLRLCAKDAPRQPWLLA